MLSLSLFTPLTKAPEGFFPQCFSLRDLSVDGYILEGCGAYWERDLFGGGLKARGTFLGLVIREPFWRGHLRRKKDIYKQRAVIRGWSLSNTFSCHIGNYKFVFVF